jgi:hypothetical protein
MIILMTANSSWNLVNFRTSLIKRLIDDGHTVVALAPRDDRSADLEELGVKFYSVVMDNQGASLLKDTLFILKIFKAVFKIKPNVILSYTIKNNLYFSIVSLATGIKIIPNVTGLGTVFIRNGRRGFLVGKRVRGYEVRPKDEWKKKG